MDKFLFARPLHIVGLPLTSLNFIVTSFLTHLFTQSDRYVIYCVTVCVIIFI